MPLIVEVSARAALLVAGVAVIMAALRIRSARMAHRAWVGVALALIALPLVVAWGPAVAIPVAGDAPHWMAGEATVAPPAAAGEVDAAPHVAVPAAAASAGAVAGARVLPVLYIAGALGLLARIIVGVVQAAGLRRQATLVDGRLTSRRCSTPITVGLRAPVVILPVTWTSWSERELAAVLAHEHEHARCRDPLAALVTLVARALFWFHPLAWWLPRHVARLSEQACDVAVVAAGHDADVYAASLVRFARAQARAGARVALSGNAMGGLALAQRLRLLQSPSVVATGCGRSVAAGLACTAIVVICCVGTPVTMSAVAAQPQAAATPPPSAPWQLVMTEHFEIHHQGEQSDRIADTAREAEDAYAELSAAFKYDLSGRVPVVLVRSEAALPLADGQSIARARVPPGRQAIVLTIESLETRRRLMVHELTHSFAFEIVPEPSRLAPWLIEGLAEHQRGVWDAVGVRAVRDAVAGAWIPNVDALASADRYWSHAFFDFIADTYGAEGIRRYLFALRTRPRIADAVSAAFGTGDAEFDRAFRRYVSGRFSTF